MTGTPRPAGRTWAIVVVVLLALLATACGVPVSATPKAIPRNQVPDQLLSPQVFSPTTSTTAPREVEPLASTIYLVGADDRLQSVPRSVSYPPLLSTVVALLDAPSSTESAAGLTTAIGTGVRLLSATLRVDGVAVINLNSAFTQITNTEQTLAVAQVVYTATAVPGVAAVQFEIHGKVIGVPTDNGAQTEKPITRAQYGQEAPDNVPPAAGATTTTTG